MMQLDALGLWVGRSQLQEIAPRVFLSNKFAAGKRRFLRKHGITHVVNCGGELDCKFRKSFQYFHVKIADNPGQDLAETFRGS